MEQLEFSFVAKEYDILTDQFRPVTHERLAVLQQVYNAYGQVREARAMLGPNGIALTFALDAVHKELMRRIRDSSRSESNDCD